MRSEVAWKKEFLVLQERYAERIAVTDAIGDMTYRELFSRAAGTASWLAGRSLRPGDAVATYLRNSLAAVSTSYGVTLAGSAEASINPHLAGDDVRHCLETCRAEILLTERARLPDLESIRNALPDLIVVAVEDIPPAELLALDAPAVAADAWGKIIFTSGTTGRPKGIVYTHADRWLANIVLRAHLPIAPAADSHLLLLTPFSHGASLMTYAYLDGGARVTLLDGVDIEEVERRLRTGGITQIFAPPTVLAKLMTAFDGQSFEDIRTIFCGTAPLSRELYRRVRACFGPVVRITYGKSETFNPITILTPGETEEWYESEDAGSSVCVGWPASGVELDFTSDDSATNETDSGANGPAPLLLRARHQLCGVLIDGVFQAHAKSDFHRTGDVGFLDGRGRLHLVGREADLMKSGGYRIGPEEVEASLRMVLPQADLCVIGLPSEYWGEVITAVAGDLDEGWEASLAELLPTMTPYKRPRLFARLDAIPRNAMGKIVRDRVREAVLQRYAMTDGPYPSLSRK